MSESMQIRKVDDLTNRVTSIELEHQKLEEEVFNKQSDFDIIVSVVSG